VLDNTDTTRAHLAAALSTAVPFLIEDLRHQPFEKIHERAREAAQVVAEKGDIILFRSKKPGATAAAFAALAEGLACLAFCPGGVTFLGLKFEARATSPAP